MLQFKVGDLVSWESQSNGSLTVKCGNVVEVIKPYHRPLFNVYRSTHSLFDYGFARSHVSYLVSVPHPGKGKPKLYWPNANKLNHQN